MTYVIAEVGSNHMGAQELGRQQCLASISAAKQAGADAVKFQAFTAEALYGPGHGALTHELPFDWLPALKEKADACGIELMCTAFSPELVAAVDPYVTVHKIASSDLSHPHLLAAVAATKKPVLLSTGASSRTDIALALNILRGRHVTLLYCVAAYPARTIDLRVMDLLRCEYDCPVGFSDHSTDILGLPLIACEEYGATVLEKHMTAFPELDTPDRPHSLTAGEFKTMVDAIRGKTLAVLGPSPEERDMLLRHNRRLIATRDIKPGELLHYGSNYGAYRALEDDDRGMSPFFWERVEGKVAKATIGRGKGVGPGDFS